MRLLGVCLLLVMPLSAEIIDMIAIAIEYQTITESQIDEELRVSSLLNHEPVEHDAAARRDAADRLVQQFLIRREMELSGYTPPNAADIGTYLGGVEKDLAASGSVAAVLKRYGVSEAVLREHLTIQLMTLRFVGFRFRPDLSVTDADVQSYLQRRAASDASSQPDKAAITRLIIAERTDAALNSWLEEARKRFNIVYFDRALQ